MKLNISANQKLPNTNNYIKGCGRSFVNHLIGLVNTHSIYIFITKCNIKITILNLIKNNLYNGEKSFKCICSITFFVKYTSFNTLWVRRGISKYTQFGITKQGQYLLGEKPQKRNTDCPKRIKIFLDKNYNSDDNINCLKGIPYNLGINIINIFYCNT